VPHFVLCSSVLEALSGVPFPRGAGLVTKCATELRMKNSKTATWNASAEINWNKDQPSSAGEKKTPEELGAAISNLTEVLTGGSDDTTFCARHSIVLKLESPDVPDLTIIDLPGIVKTAVQGQQHTVVDEVNGLIESYLQQARSIILAVVPANVDVTTSVFIVRIHCWSSLNSMHRSRLSTFSSARGKQIPKGTAPSECSRSQISSTTALKKKSSRCSRTCASRSILGTS